MELEKEVKEIIEKSLPKHVGEVLAKRLLKAEEDERTAKEVTSANVKLHATVDQLTQKIRELNAKDAAITTRIKDFKSREKALVNAETDRKLIEMRAENAEARVQDHKDMMMTVFRVATVRESIHTSTFDNDSLTDNGSQYRSVQKTKSGGSTVTKETTKE